MTRRSVQTAKAQAGGTRREGKPGLQNVNIRDWKLRDKALHRNDAASVSSRKWHLFSYRYINPSLVKPLQQSSSSAVSELERVQFPLDRNLIFVALISMPFI